MSDNEENLSLNEPLGFMVGESLYVQFPLDDAIFEENENGEVFIVFDVYRVINEQREKVTNPNETLTHEEVEVLEKAVEAMLERSLEYARSITGEIE